MSEYYTVLTHLGAQKVAAAIAGGPALELTDLVVGDGGGGHFYENHDREALKARSSLINQRWSGPLYLVDKDPQNPAWAITEGQVPVDVGGWYIREVGIQDRTGDLIAIGVYPETYKPVLAAQIGADLTLRSIIEVGDANTVTLKIDPSVVQATREWVNAQFAEKSSIAPQPHKLPIANADGMIDQRWLPGNNKQFDPAAVLVYVLNTESLTVEISFSSNVNALIDWGDGTSEQVNRDAVIPAHTYATPGTYRVRITGSAVKFSVGGYAGAERLTRVESWGVGLGLTSLSGCFRSLANNIKYLPSHIPLGVSDLAYFFHHNHHVPRAVEKMDVSNVTSFSGTFWNAKGFNWDISNWDVSNARSFSAMFRDGEAFNQDIGKWDVSSATNMSRMLQNTLIDQDLSQWDVSNVINFENFLLNTKFSTANYDKLLIGWSKLLLKPNASFHGGNAKYSAAAALARQKIITDFGWTITDGGLEE
ncbi:phage tail protein [Halomonas sp. MC140]|nr:phage tail protein [Halomonas sp. MC140]MDN7131773.1 phage tail protein [Halomonas sp. MC140]